MTFSTRSSCSITASAANYKNMPSDVESDDDTSDSLSVIKKYSCHEAMAAVSVLKDFTADRGLNDILNSMFNIENKICRWTIVHQFIFQTAVSCFMTFILKEQVFIKIFLKFNSA